MTPDEKIKQLESKVKSLTDHIKDIEDAIEYCKRYEIDFECILTLITAYENRHENDDWLSDQEADKADFDNKLEKEDW